MNKAIIHISDLHIMNFFDVDGIPLTKFNSWLIVNKQSDNDRYINAFIDFIKKTYPDFSFYLVITGDLTDSASSNEFEELNRILNKICNDLSISKESVLIIPGDHDVNRLDAQNARVKDSNKKAVFDYNIEKFKEFSTFYNTFYDEKKIFDAQKAVSSVLAIDEAKILYVGFNSNFHIGAKSGKGFIDPDTLEKELIIINDSYDNTYTKIACFHHNFIPFYKEEVKGQWEPNNLNDVKRLLEIYKMDSCYVYGNEHTPYSELKLGVKNISIGSFSYKAPPPTFNVFKINDKNYFLENTLYQLSNHNIKDLNDFGIWDLYNGGRGEIEKIDLKTPVAELPLVFSDGLPSAEVIKSELPPKSEDYIPFENDNKKHKELLRIIKKENLFHTGHFHWSETSRAHGWIDVSKLLSNKDNLNKCKKYIYETLVKSNVTYDFVIGLGVEGNILATRTAILSSKPYSFLPYSYRYDDHSKFEKLLNFDNNSKFKTILIITDVVHDGRTIRKLIHKKREEDTTSEFFVGVEKIIVVSLFYTGQLPNSKDKYHDIINKHEEGEDFDSENDHLENRIEFHFVSHIKVEECPYNKNNYKTDCIIVKEGLGCIHKFYTEK